MLPGPPAILLGGEPTALAVARSLAAAGVAVTALGDRLRDPCARSRCVDRFIDVGRGPGVQERTLSRLEEGPGAGIVLPCHDDGLELVARRRSELASLGYTSIEADDEVLLAMLDKERTYELARAAGIPVPRTAVVSTSEDALEAAARIGYPCALKPRHSHRFANHFSGQKAFVVEDEPALEAGFATAGGLGLELIVTEIVRGADDSFVSYYGYLDQNGDSLLNVTKRKVRNFPPGFGVGSYHVTEWLPEVAEIGLRFMRAVGIRGLACPEFKLSARDGRLTLIECNHRFTMATAQLRACGVDLPRLVYGRVVGLPVQAVDSYRTGVGFWYPVRDARAFRIYRRHGELSLVDWLRTLMRPQRFPIASLSDPMPSLAEGWRKARRFPTRLDSIRGDGARDA